jgi:hypothetical protein
MQNLNGVFFPGGEGGSDIVLGSGSYWTFTKEIWTNAKKINDAGTFFPLYGTCLGF